MVAEICFRITCGFCEDTSNPGKPSTDHCSISVADIFGFLYFFLSTLIFIWKFPSKNHKAKITDLRAGTYDNKEILEIKCLKGLKTWLL